MSKTVEASVEIARAPWDVFDYVSDAELLPQWQRDVESAGADPPGVRQVGMSGHEIRRVPGGPRTIRWVVTACDPGTRWSTRVVEGPLRPEVTMRLTPVAGGSRTRLDYAIRFEGHGIGRLLAVLAGQGTRRDLPATLRQLREQLEGSDVSSQSGEGQE
jgi:uncharacterized protein YndB with AHSA1/START domain